MRKITLGHLNINAAGKRYVNEALNENRLSRGRFTDRFEREFAQLHQVKHALFCNSGTSALQIALAALKEVYGYKDGDEVLVPATTFIATSNIVLQNNLKPVFVDVDPFTYNMAPYQIEKSITDKTRTIIPVHLFGLPADMDRIKQIAYRHGLQILEDSCETMFASANGKSVGSWGDIACFSTYVAHLIVGGVGGIVTTSNDQLNDICKSLMNHGRDINYINIDDDEQSTPDIIERRYQFERIGYSYRATELEAAIALSELESYQENIGTRRKNAAHLTELLADIHWLQKPYVPADLTHSFMMYPIVLYDNFKRDQLLNYLEKNGIETRYMLPLLNQPVYQKLFPRLESKHPVARKLSELGFFIGMHQGLTKDDVEYISDVFHRYEYIK
jgi:dTDP-4-amino-4,6-dideoxygalactose transaminase